MKGREVVHKRTLKLNHIQRVAEPYELTPLFFLLAAISASLLASSSLVTSSVRFQIRWTRISWQLQRSFMCQTEVKIGSCTCLCCFAISLYNSGFNRFNVGASYYFCPGPLLKLTVDPLPYPPVELIIDLRVFSPAPFSKNIKI